MVSLNMFLCLRAVRDCDERVVAFRMGVGEMAKCQCPSRNMDLAV